MLIGIPMWTMLTYFHSRSLQYVSQWWNWKQKTILHDLLLKYSKWIVIHTFTFTFTFASLRLEHHSFTSLFVWERWHFDIKTHIRKNIILSVSLSLSIKCLLRESEREKELSSLLCSPLQKVKTQTISIMSKFKLELNKFYAYDEQNFNAGWRFSERLFFPKSWASKSDML